jgi:hypothetical protein
MKSRSARQFLLRSGIALIVFGIAAWIGGGLSVDGVAGSQSDNGIGKKTSSSSVVDRLPADKQAIHPHSHGHRSEPPEARARRVAAVKEQVKRLWMVHSEYGLNWELDDETHRLLATLDAEDLKAFLHEVPPMGGLPSHTFLRLEIVKAWAVKDGPGAVAGCSVGHRIDHLVRARALGAWGGVAPDAALAWLRQEDLPGDLEQYRGPMRSNLFRDLAKSHFALVEKELPLLGANDRSSLLPTLVSAAAEQNLPVDGLLAMAREFTPEGKMSEAEKWLFMDLAAKDPEAALGRIQSAEHLGEEERRELDGIVLSRQAGSSPATAFDAWLERNPGIDSIPEAAGNTVANAMQSRREEMIGWIGSLPEGQLRDQFHERGIRSLAGMRRFEDAVRLSSGISDSATRATALIVLRDFWKNADPAAAGKWLESLPAADRQLLGD